MKLKQKPRIRHGHDSQDLFKESWGRISSSYVQSFMHLCTNVNAESWVVVLCCIIGDVGLHIDKCESDKMQGRRSIFKVLDYIRVHTGNYDKASWCKWLRTGSHTHLISRLLLPSNMLEGRSEVDAYNPLIKWAPYKRRVRLSVLRRLFAPTSPVQVGRSYDFIEKPKWNIFPPGILAENWKQAIR